MNRSHAVFAAVFTGAAGAASFGAPIHLASITDQGMSGVGASLPAGAAGAVEFWLNFPVTATSLGRSLVRFNEGSAAQQELFEITSADDANFGAFAALLSNGAPDLLHVRAGVVGGGGNALQGSDFQLLFQFQDLIGAELSSVRFVVNDLKITRDDDLLIANWTSFEWQLWGTAHVAWPPVAPAPGAAVSLVGAAGLVAGRRHRG